MSGFTVAKAYSAKPESADELAVLVTAASGETVNRSELIGLAGPNHAIQILADIPTWLQYAASAIASGVFGGFVGQFGAEPATKLINAVKSKITGKTDCAPSNIDVEAIARAIVKVALQNRDTQTLTMAIPMQTMNARNFGLELSGLLGVVDKGYP